MPRALLLSPDDQAVSAITGVLEEMSVTCARPLDGVSAAQELNSHNFDLVLVDCENLSAAKLIFDVCRRGKNGNSPVPIAIADGRAGLPTAFRLGAELILTKPVAKDQARSTIRTAVGRARKEFAANERVPAQPARAAGPNADATGAASAGEPAQAAAAPKLNLEPTLCPSPSSAAPLPEETSSDQIAAASPKPAPPAVTSDDPALAEPERMELQPSQLESPEPDREAPKQPANKPDVPVFPSHRQSQSIKRAPLGALLMLALAGAGFYAAWTYQPGFQAMAHSQIDRVLALAKIARQPQFKPAAAASHLAQPPAQMAPATTSATAPGAPADLNHTPSAVPRSAPNSATTATAGTPTALPIAPAAAPAFDAQLPGEKSAVILSSKSAEKRLEHSVPPKYPAAAQSGETQGTVVLKVTVDENGKVEGLRLVEGNAAQATAAIEAVKQWHYRPYVRDGKTLPFQTVVIVDFQRP